MAVYTGDDGDNSITGGVATDNIEAGAGNDTISGGQGNDYLSGSRGSDVYMFNLGDGQDYIYEYDYSASNSGVNEDTDILILGDGISTGNVTVRRDSSDNITISIDGTDDAIHIRNLLYGPAYQVEEVHFADGTQWNVSDLFQAAIVPSEGDDEIHGTSAAETISGLGGDDQIYGEGGNDVLDGGDGADRIYSQGQDSSLSGGAGNDNLLGGDGQDKLTGGTGNDYMAGYGGSDTYYFNVGDGADLIYEYDYGFNDTDVLVLGSGITADDVSVHSDSSGWLTIAVDGTSDSVEFVDFMSQPESRVEEIHFADGTTWTAQDLIQRAGIGTDGDDEMSGTPDADTISGLDGDDAIYAGSGNDVLSGGKNDDYLSGSRGSDTYVFNLGDGHDTISEYDQSAYYGTNVDTDIITLGTGITTADVTAHRTSGDDLVLSIGASGDSITIRGFYSDLSKQVEEVHFINGDILDVADLVALANIPTEADDYISGTSGNDTLSGLGGSDILKGDLGNDVLSGGAGEDHLVGSKGNDTLAGGVDDDQLEGGSGSDTYVFNLGDGADTIYEYDFGSDADGVNDDSDVIQFGTGITTDNVTVKLDSGGDLILTVGGTSDSITIDGFLGNLGSQVEQVRFADNSLWDAQKLVELANTGTAGNDNLYGTSNGEALSGLGGDDYIQARSGNDTLAGGTGADELNGGGGSDTYVFNLGDGKDLIYEYDNGAFSYGTNEDSDVIILGSGITADQLVVRADADGDLIISIAGTDDSITIDNFMQELSSQIEELRFADNTSWSAQQLYDKANSPTELADYLVGTSGNDSISGLGGDDWISGNAGNDTLAGGTGDDELNGGSGSDTYVFNVGDGNDTIDDYDASSNTDIDVITLGSGITTADVAVHASANGDLVLSFGADDSITITDFMSSSENHIEQLHFSDGTTWSVDDLKALARNGTDQDDYLVGTTGQDTISGLAGDDNINGDAGADTLDGGDGFDSVFGFGGDDTITGGNDGDRLYGGADNDILNGNAGNDMLYGESGNDTIAGGTGSDIVNGSTGSDTYYFNIGDGEDYLSEYDYAAYNNGVNADSDIIVLGAGITADNVAVRATASGALVISINGTQDRITIDDFFGGLENQVEAVHFDNGTQWTAADLVARANTPTEGTDYLQGSSGADSLSGLGGDDYINSRAGNDTLTGGTGDDTLAGGAGSDTYVFNLGDGKDTIYETAANGADSDTDVIMFGQGISVSDISVRRTSGGNLVLSIGDSDSIVVEDFFSSSGKQIESVHFADGTTWNVAHLTELASTPTDKDDYLVGTSSKDTISGLGGEDYIDGGNDNDVLSGNAGGDTLVGGSGSDTLAGGTGDDILMGGADSDTYIFNLGDGKDVIGGPYSYYYGSDGGSDMIIFGDGIAAADVSVRADRHGDLTLSIGASDSITISDFMDDEHGQIAQVKFADGTTWGVDDLLLKSRVTTEGKDFIFGSIDNETITGLGGNDYVAGNDGNDVLTGGKGGDQLYGQNGNDTLSGGDGTDRLVGGRGDDILTGGKADDEIDGGGGSDTYYFNLGDADDAITEYDYNAANYGTNEDDDILILGDGITTANIHAHSDGDGILLTFDGTDDTIYLNGFVDGLENQIEEIRFAGGDIWTAQDLIDRASAATAADDQIYGTDGNDNLSGLGGDDSIYAGYGNDTLTGGTGDDALSGSRGSDTYVFNLGDGADTINEYDFGGYNNGTNTDHDVIVLGSGITTSDVTVSTNTNGDLTLAVNGTGDSITVSGFRGNLGNQIEEVHFSNGDVWNADYLAGLISGPTDLADRIEGTVGNDTLSGLGGDDDIRGNGGDDVINGGEGNDDLYGLDGADTLTGGSGNDFLRGGDGSDTYVFHLGDGADEISNYDYGATTDIVVLGAGITTANLTIHSTANGGVVLSVAGTNDSITLDGMLLGNGQIDEVHFDDGSILTASQIQAQARLATDGNDFLYGSSADEVFDGLGGDDRISAGLGNDTLTGGSGDDALYGDRGSDTYYFNLGDGADRIIEYDYSSSYGENDDTDVIVFGSGISTADVTVSRNGGEDLMLSIAGATDSIRIINFFVDLSYQVEQVRFADGTTWTAADLISRAAVTSDDDIIAGTDAGETLSGLSGDDSISGLGGDDTLIGGDGNDDLDGGDGSDTYVFNLGDDSDWINEQDADDTETISFGSGISADNVTVRMNSNGDLILSIDGTGDRIRVDNFIHGSDYVIDQVRFADNTVWDVSELIQRAITPTAGSDTIWGVKEGETLSGLGGDDYIHSGNGADTLIGGTGADYLEGGYGSDIYVFNLGDGVDEISEYDYSVNRYGLNEDEDAIVFGDGITAADVHARRNGGNLILSIGASGDRIQVDGFFNGLGNQIEEVRFANGDVWDADKIEDLALLAGINHAPTDISLSAATLAENSAAGTQIGTISGTDQDADDPLIYTLIDDANGAFSIVDGKLVVANSSRINFESSSTMSVVVRATDSSGVSYQELLTINVTDAAEKPTDIGLTGTVVAENAVAGTVVGTLSASDPDAGDTVSYTLTDDAGGMFTVADGKIAVNTGASLDFEAHGSYSVTVRATDSHGLTFDEIFSIGVTDLNEAPSDIVLSASSVAEDAAAGAIVGVLSGTDPDTGDSLGYSLTDDAGGAFSLVDGKIVVNTGASFDFETKSSYSITVVSTDAGGLTRSEELAILVTDINEAPTDISLSGTKIAENSKAGKAIGTFSATDPDAGETFSYDLKNDAKGTFDIVGNKLVVAKGAHLDFEAIKTYSITVTVSDGALTHDETFKIAVTDVREAINGTGKNDNLKGTSLADTILAGNGNDILRGLAGGDLLNGGNGIDTASYADAKKGVLANLASVAKNTGDAHGDKYVGIENLTGSKSADTLIGNSKNNALDGGKGNDKLTGAGGSDTFIFAAKYGTDTVTDFAFKGKHHDFVDLSDAAGITNFDDLMKHHVKEVGHDLHITASDKSVLVLLDIDKADLSKADFLF